MRMLGGNTSASDLPVENEKRTEQEALSCCALLDVAKVAKNLADVQHFILKKERVKYSVVKRNKNSYGDKEASGARSENRQKNTFFMVFF